MASALLPGDASAAPSHPSGSGQPERILVVAPAWVGDMVMAHTLIRLLAERRPEAEIHVLAPAATLPLAARMAEVAAGHLLPVGHGELGLVRRYRVARSLRRLRFHRALVLPNTLKSALVPVWAGIPVRTGWHGESRYGLLNDRRRLPPSRRRPDAAGLPMAERFLALALPAAEAVPGNWPRPVLEVDGGNRDRLMTELGLSGAGGVLALCPGAEFGPAKRWPAAHYAAVARSAAGRSRRVWLLGSAADAEVCEAIRARAPGAVNLAGRTRLVDAVDLLSAADAVVCNDSGLMHVAAAVGTPVVAVFGATSPAFTPPLTDRARVLRLGLPCSPCFQPTCPLGHGRCLADLEPDRVLEALESLRPFRASSPAVSGAGFEQAPG